MEEKLLTPLEVADMLRVKESTVRDWFRKGKMQGIKLPGGDLRIKESTLNEILGKQPA